MENINIKNENLANYVMFKLDKTENSFTNEELAQITELNINFSEEENQNISFSELLIFPNLEDLVIRNWYIESYDFDYFKKLEKLDSITFERCEFDDYSLIATLNLKSLSLINCKIDNYDFVGNLSNLEELTICNDKVNVDMLNKLIKLNYLQLSYCTINGTINDLKLNNIKELYIDNTNVDNLDFVNNYSKLNRLSIDKKQYTSNTELVNKLVSKKVAVYDENMVLIGGENNDNEL